MGCKQCNKKICDSDRIVCRGFCESAFHMICVKVDVPALDVMGMHPNNFFWMCDECRGGRHFRANRAIKLPFQTFAAFTFTFPF
ncbi:c-AMP-dependent rap1 guanine-nucleotide exchange factor [Culex quinquefasciatus]|uniref:C-AMP-dependent rap1 guanine-nucleotide exchange factor n=1 Tax=Culex quinquefasciatus TaxID=7176 RepID=B0XH64_CULQU|nr:c-AMP-dependent rap1 guanine-nucleotide exchange factor [Culex quinquefasciatus]|eukprot:XP_001868986.1 c-AMP-dependent rap1 guanine-nucleotide exchange factor [Culex quinquefasciatus]